MLLEVTVRLSRGGEGPGGEPGQRLQLSSWFCPMSGEAGEELGEYSTGGCGFV